MIKCIIRLLFILLLCESANASPTDTTKQEIKAIEVQESGPLFGERFYRVFHAGPYVVYQSRYLSNSFDIQPTYDSVAHQDALISNQERSEWKDDYFVFHKDSSYGIRYDQADSAYTQRFKVDSYLQTIEGTNSFEGVLLGKPDTATWNENRTVLKEVYVGKPQKDTLTASLVLYYSNRMSHITESLNRKLDSARLLKLFKIEILTNEFYSEKDKQLWPAMKISSTLKEISVENPAEVTSYINRYRSMGVQGKRSVAEK